MSDFNLIGPLTVTAGSYSRIVALDPARNLDIAATVTIGNLPIATTVDLELIQASTLSSGGTNEDPATVFADSSRVYKQSYSGTAAGWSLGAVLAGRFSHLRIKNNGAASLTATILC